MGASSVTGKGIGSAEGTNKGPQNNRQIYVTLQQPHVITAGEVLNDDNCWQIEVIIPGLTESPENYVVMITQSDWTNYDGRPNNPAHIEKIDQNGNNLSDNNDVWPADAVMGGFILHTGDDSCTDWDCYPRRFGFVVVKTGVGSTYSCY
jgi:hypothetical protein